MNTKNSSNQTLTIMHNNNIFVKKPHPFSEEERLITLYLLRSTEDFAFFSTDGKKLDSIFLQAQNGSLGNEKYILFSGRKQKAVENRSFASYIFSLSSQFNLSYQDTFCRVKYPCHNCPRCVLFGSIPFRNPKQPKGSFLPSRVFYHQAVSITPFVSSIMTDVVGITDDISNTQEVEFRQIILPGVIFPSIVTLKNVTFEEFVTLFRNCSTLHRYGKNTGTMGLVRNQIVAVAYGNKQPISSFEWARLLRSKGVATFDKRGISEITFEFLSNKIKNQSDVCALTPQEVESLNGEIKNFPMDTAFVTALFETAAAYADEFQKEAEE